MLRIGIDDAGRGPLIGPMILAAVLIPETKEQGLKELGAKDSKLLVHSERVRLASLIKKQATATKTISLSPAEIDEAVLRGKNLNTLEAQKMAFLVNELNDAKTPTTVIVDCPSVNVEAWKKTFTSFITHTTNLTILCEHKADYNHPVVSAASILAKVEREEAVSLIKKQYGDIGSGYPADPITKQFLEEHGKSFRETGIFRKSWATWTDLFPEDKMKKSYKQNKLF